MKTYIGKEQPLEIKYSLELIAGGQPLYTTLHESCEDAIAEVEHAPRSACVPQWDRINVNQVAVKGGIIVAVSRIVGFEPEE